MILDQIIAAAKLQFDAELELVIAKMQDRIQRDMERYKTADGSFTTEGISEIGRLANTRSDLLRIASEAGYDDLVQDYTDTVYKGVLEEIEAEYDKMGYADAFSGVDVQTLNMAAQYDLAELRGISQEASTTISRMIFQGVAGQADRVDTINQVRGQLSDYYKRWASGYVTTATHNFARLVEDQIQEEAEIERFEYSGPLDANTREFCQDLLESGESYSREEIAAMDNGQTPIGTVKTLGGGFNCRHRWEPAESEFEQDEAVEGARAEEEIAAEESVELEGREQPALELPTLEDYMSGLSKVEIEQIENLIENWKGVGFATIRKVQQLSEAEFALKYPSVSTDYAMRLAQANQLQALVENHGTYTGMVYRGLSFKTGRELQSAMKQFRGNGSVEFNALSSASTSRDRAAEFTYGEVRPSILMEIECNKGLDIKPATSGKYEQEIILGKGAKFNIKEIVKSGKDDFVIKLEQI